VFLVLLVALAVNVIVGVNSEYNINRYVQQIYTIAAY
jgi:hypothetical protein